MFVSRSKAPTIGGRLVYRPLWEGRRGEPQFSPRKASRRILRIAVCNLSCLWNDEYNSKRKYLYGFARSEACLQALDDLEKVKENIKLFKDGKCEYALPFKKPRKICPHKVKLGDEA